MPPDDAGIDTLAVHAGTRDEQPEGAVTVPIYQSSTYTFRDTAELRAHFAGEPHRMEYGRYGNPTQRACERKLAALEGAGGALLFGSGMAAITTTLMALVRQGQHVILAGDCYRRTRQFCQSVLGRFGVQSTLTDNNDLQAIESALQKNTRVIITESPTNPYLNCVDVAALEALRARVAARFKILIDATFATPINLRPLALGADLVVHSATKYLGGHNDLLAGVVAGPAPMIDAIRDLQGVLGGVIDPHAAYLLLRGLKTLPLRVRRQNESALALARTLSARPEVDRVYYPGLPSHPSHAIARETMSGFGGVVSFTLKADLEGTSRFIDATRIFGIGPSLGGVESLIEQVAVMSYVELSTEQRQAIGISDSLVRMAVGLESVEDLERDLLDALGAV